MAGLYDVTVTSAGATLLAQAAQSGAQVVFTRARLGSGIITGDYSGRADLATPVCYSGLDAATIAGNVIKAPVLFSNKDLTAGFTFNEIGLFGKLGTSGAETMLAYANAGAEGGGVSVPDKSVLTEFTYLFKLAFASASAITVSSEAIAYVTPEAMSAALAKKSDAGHKHVMADITDLSTAKDIGVNLPAAGWASGAQTVSVAGVLAGDAQTIEVGLAKTATKAQVAAAAVAGVWATGNAAGTITFSALNGTAPTIDIPLVIRIVG